MKHVSPVLIIPLALGLASSARAQALSLPPSGGNQVSSVTQGIGLVRVSVDYSSPDVAGRQGKIWGELVTYGYAKFGFGTCGEKCPWRAGANENTILTTSHALQVEGQALPAGRYGVHMIPGEKTWTVIFSKSSDAWGSYFYEEKNDALRVTVTPKKAPFTEYLNYVFTERKADQATLEMQWDELAVPIRLTVPNLNALHVAQIREELTGSPGFSDVRWRQAANFCLQNDINLEEGLRWAEYAVKGPFVGQENFSNLTTLALLQAANGDAKAAQATEKRAFGHATASPGSIHSYGRALLARGEKKRALEVFRANAKKHPNQWPVNVGLGRGYSALGDYKKAAEHIEAAIKQAPDPGNKANLEKALETLKAGQPMS